MKIETLNDAIGALDETIVSDFLELDEALRKKRARRRRVHTAFLRFGGVAALLVVALLTALALSLVGGEAGGKESETTAVHSLEALVYGAADVLENFDADRIVWGGENAEADPLPDSDDVENPSDTWQTSEMEGVENPYSTWNGLLVDGELLLALSAADDDAILAIAPVSTAVPNISLELYEYNGRSVEKIRAEREAAIERLDALACLKEIVCSVYGSEKELLGQLEALEPALWEPYYADGVFDERKLADAITEAEELSNALYLEYRQAVEAYRLEYSALPDPQALANEGYYVVSAGGLYYLFVTREELAGLADAIETHYGAALLRELHFTLARRDVVNCTTDDTTDDRASGGDGAEVEETIEPAEDTAIAVESLLSGSGEVVTEWDD